MLKFSWNAIGSLFGGTSTVDGQLKAGAVDVVAVAQVGAGPVSGPFHVRMGRSEGLGARGKTSVKVRINGVDTSLKMKLGMSGEAFFVEKTSRILRAVEGEGSREISKTDDANKYCLEPSKERSDSYSAPLNLLYEGSSQSALKSLTRSRSFSTNDVIVSSVPSSIADGDERFINNGSNSIKNGSGDNLKSLDDIALTRINSNEFSISSGSTYSSSFPNSPSLYLSNFEEKPTRNQHSIWSDTDQFTPQTGSDQQINKFPSLPILYSYEEDSDHLLIHNDSPQSLFSPSSEQNHYEGDFGNLIALDDPSSSTSVCYNLTPGIMVSELKNTSDTDEVSKVVVSPSSVLTSISNSSANKSSKYSEELYREMSRMDESTEVIESIEDIQLSDILPGPATGDFHDSDTESYASMSQDEDEPWSIASEAVTKPKYQYKKVLVPTKEQLKELSAVINEGRNEISYELENCPPVKSDLYLWPADARIVVIDLEGAISVSNTNINAKSSNNSGILTSLFFGSSENKSKNPNPDQMHEGLAQLLTSIHNNGYKILYLTQDTLDSKDTLQSLFSVNKLPLGPVINSPDVVASKGTLYASKPELVKAAVLRGLTNLFNPSHNPFYACFFQNETAMRAFTSCKISPGKIFVVGSSGDIRSMNSTVKRSFKDLHLLLNEMFPPIADAHARKLTYKVHNEPTDERFSDINHWRLPIPDLKDD